MAQAPPRDSLGNPAEGRVGGLITRHEERSDEYHFCGFAGGEAAAG